MEEITLIKKALAERVAKAIYLDNTAVVSRNELTTAEGLSEVSFNNLGLSKQDLKRLERAGVAIRGYSKHMKGSIHRGSELKRVWVLVKENENEQTETRSSGTEIRETDSISEPTERPNEA
jgi:hypothetical protein